VFVRFELNPSECHPFDGEQGQRFMLVAVRIGNDELPCDNPPLEKLTKAPPVSKAKERYAEASGGEKAVVRAGALAKDERFWKYASTIFRQTIKDDVHAAEFIRNYCECCSRSNLKNDKKALQIFLALENDFRQWAGMTAEVR